MSKKPKKKEEQTENSEEVQNQEEAPSDLQKFVATALRQPRGGIYEQLLSQFLAQSVVVTDPLKRIKIVTEAALLIPERERENLAVDYEHVTVLNLVANALLNPSAEKRENIAVVSIPWGFPQTEENYKTFILPWYNCKPFFWPRLLRKHAETWRTWRCLQCRGEVLKAKLPFPDTLRTPRVCPKCGRHLTFNAEYVTVSDLTEVINEPSWSFFFEMSTYLTPQGYDLLRNNFAAWAIPKVQLILAELTQVVSPALYAEVIGLYTRNSKRSYAEKVKEAAKPAEAPTDET